MDQIIKIHDDMDLSYFPKNENSKSKILIQDSKIKTKVFKNTKSFQKSSISK